MQSEPSVWTLNWPYAVIMILHYTVSKGWHNLHHFKLTDPADSLLCWERGTTALCTLWETV